MVPGVNINPTLHARAEIGFDEHSETFGTVGTIGTYGTLPAFETAGMIRTI